MSDKDFEREDTLENEPQNEITNTDFADIESQINDSTSTDTENAENIDVSSNENGETNDGGIADGDSDTEKTDADTLLTEENNGENDGENNTDEKINEPQSTQTPKIHESFVQSSTEKDIEVSVKALNKGFMKLLWIISAILITISFLSIPISDRFNYVSFVLGLFTLGIAVLCKSGIKNIVADTIQKYQGKVEEFKFFNTYFEYRLYKGSELLKFVKVPYKEIEQVMDVEHLIIIKHDSICYCIRKSLFSLGSKMKPFLLNLEAQIRLKNSKNQPRNKSKKIFIAIIALAVSVMLIFAIATVLDNGDGEEGGDPLAILVTELCEKTQITPPEARRYEQEVLSVPLDETTDIEITKTVAHMSKKQLTQFDNSFKESNENIIWFTFPPEKLYNEFEFVIFPEYDSFFIYNITEETYNRVPKTDGECEYIFVGYNSKDTTIEFLTFSK